MIWHLLVINVSMGVMMVIRFRNEGNTLPDSVALPSARGTRQRPICTRQRLCRVLHSAKATRQKMGRQRRLCRVSFVGHSAKPLPSARHSVKLKPKKTWKNGNFYPKKMEFFLSMEAPTGQRPPIYNIFRVNFMATRPTRFEPETSRCARTSSTTTPHTSYLCLDSVLVPNILY